MADATDVYPARDLPGRADNWGRRVEEVGKDLFSRQVQLQQSLDNGLRSASGQLAVLADQLNELRLGRRSHSTQPADVSLTATTPGVYPTYERDFTLPGPYEASRSSQISISAMFSRTSVSGNMTIWTELLRSGDVIWRRTGAVVVGAPASAPPEWADMGFSDTFYVMTPPGNHTYTLRFYCHTFVAETVTAEVSDMVAVISYGDPA